ncbi:Rtf2 RING-finger-domain-containing protein [Talaromyces proteolyticus]|uniref:Rtf2 RING-finger-domain-containing protein n=1 Tax=Talaromyces proteolyticus TaxID=1131652 RepID=A0AAD4PYU2_9EURO|nr:Rtf2 RING-finger-domain-containing protein [Talaromyces proteolyticus]KAH8698321.1 Rtf2 RING-finger-domain-containing protein [Talaromyces proteolyticus]
MGNDGGSIPTRRELVREAAKAPSATQVKEAQREQQEHCWTTCPLSHKPLLRPIVSDSVGNLYNKDAILKYLIGAEDEDISSKADCDEILQGRLKSLRDVVELKFEIDDSPDNSPAAQKDASHKGETWVCPITRKELGPSVKSVYIVPCGHVFAEEAVREMKGDKCLQCTEPYTEDNVIVILPTKEADKQRQMARGQKLSEQGLTHSLKKLSGSKKRKKHANGESSATAETPSSKATATTNGSSGIKNAATAMLTAKVLEEESKKKKQKVAGRNGNLESLFHNDKTKRQLKDGDFMTRGFSIPADARRS